MTMVPCDFNCIYRLLTAGKANIRDIDRQTDRAAMHSSSQAQLDGKQADQETSSLQDDHEQQLQQQLPKQVPEQEQVVTSDDPSDQGPAQNGEALISQGSEHTQQGISDARVPQASGQIDCPAPSQGSESQPGVLMLLCVLSLMSRLVSHHVMCEHLPLAVLEQHVTTVPDQRNDMSDECHSWPVSKLIQAINQITCNCV